MLYMSILITEKVFVLSLDGDPSVEKYMARKSSEAVPGN